MQNGESDQDIPQPPPPPPWEARRSSPSAWKQFKAVLYKNWLLRLKGGRRWFGLGGAAPAVLDILVPVLFFLVMCIPKHYVKPIPSPRQLSPAYPADMAGWGELYMGPASTRPDLAARIHFAPNTTAVQQLMLLLAKAAACPPDAVRPRRNSSASFYQYWAAAAGAAASAGHPECLTGGAAACRAQPACYLPLFERQLVGHASGDEAAAAAAAQPGTVDAVLDLTGWAQQARQTPQPAQHAAAAPPQRQGGVPLRPPSPSPANNRGVERGGSTGGPPAGTSPFLFRYSLRMNHTDVPPTRMRLNQFDLLPGNQYKQYWFFANLQVLVEQAMLAHAAASAAGAAGGATAAGDGSGPSGARASAGAGGPAPGSPGWLAAAAASSPALLPLELSVKPFPWPALTLDLGATAAALFFNMLLVFAFLQPTRAAVASIVQEKELLLREGMRILGLRDGAYWGSWFLSHWAGMAASGTLCALVGLYPFAHSSLPLMLAFYWLVAAALLLFAYCLSTLFSKARVAGGAASVLYSLAMMPGYMMPSLQPYGGAGWALSCLLPPSAISLFASVLVKHEAAQQGLTWRSLSQPVTVEHSFSAASVYQMLLLDILLYGLLLWYLDKAMPSDVGQRLPWTFPLSPDYWRPRRASKPAVSGAAGSGSRARRAGTQAVGAGTETASADGEAGGQAGEPALRIRGLCKVFRTTDGMEKVAVDGLDLEVGRGQITALLGHNGAGKTTTISILTGLLSPTAGDALFYPSTAGGGSAADSSVAGGGALSILRDLPAIRASLGVCPQFDVLWPQLSVREHLELFAAIRGYAREDRPALAAAAAAEVGLSSKLGAAAGELSGGQRRKLSVALAFVGSPSVVILDEPTSGMDPYTRRFTWGAIQRRRATAGTAVLLTTHSMEEADLLADRIAIMAHGRLAALGTSLELKSRFGVGYTLTLSRAPPAAPAAPTAAAPSAGSRAAGAGNGDGSSESFERVAETALSAPGAAAAPGGAAAWGEDSPAVADIVALVREHVKDAQLLSASDAEVAIRLPKEAAPAFPPLLRTLEAGPARTLGVASFGLSVTTLEEVFLRVSESAGVDCGEADPAEDRAATGSAGGGRAAQQPSGKQVAVGLPPAGAGAAPADLDDAELDVDRSEFVVVNVPHRCYLRGWALWRQQLRALLAKRALCAMRDTWAALMQVAVPVLLVALALWGNRLSTALPHQPALALDRATALSGNPAVFGASATVRAGGNGSAPLGSLLAAYPGAQDSGTDRMLILPFIEPLAGTLDEWLLGQWYNSSSRRHYDAFFLQTLPSLAAAPGPAPGAAAGAAAAQWSSTAAATRAALGTAYAAAGAAPAGPTLQYSVLANQTAIHGLPAAISQVHAALLRWLTGDPAAGIQLSSHPLPVLVREVAARIGEAAGTLLLVLCVVLAAAVLSASFAVFLVRERASGSKWVQLVAGARPSAFWAANLLFDLAFFSVPAALMVVLFAGFGLPAYHGERLAAAAAVLWASAPASLCLTYLGQAAFEDEVRALTRINSLFFTTGYLGYLAVWILDTIHRLLPTRGVDHARRLLRLLLQALSPHFCLARGVHLVGETYHKDPFSTHLESALPSVAGTASASRSHAAGPALGARLPAGGIPGGTGSSPWAWDVTGGLLASLAWQTALYGSAVLLLEAGVLYRLWRHATAAWAASRRGGAGGASGAGYERLPGQEEGEAAASAAAEDSPASHAAAAERGEVIAEDEDVAAERRMLQSGPPSLPVLLLGVSKSFVQQPGGAPGGSEAPVRTGGPDPRAHTAGGGSQPVLVRAVQDLWLGIGRHQQGQQQQQQQQQEPGVAMADGGQQGSGHGSARSGASAAGECFGLLGVNGAGKTTTFRMVTGEVAPDAGDASVCGESLLERPGAARQHLGYCPQASALPAQMTGREVVRLYARLRGLPERLVPAEATRLLKHLGLREYANRACGSYSGGNRRKLSVAVALVGGAEVILLDEPSTGMDPGARRALWGVIREEMRRGRTVLLTSHSMEECEAVCGRVGIMAAGRLRALGSVQHLKSKHGQGYCLELKVARGYAAAAAQLVAACCPAAEHRPEHWQAQAAALATVGTAHVATDPWHGAGMSGGSEAGSEHGGAGNATQHLSFCIPQTQADLPALFEALEHGRSTAGVLDYSLTQTTLEQVFLALASGSLGAGGSVPPSST